MPDEENIDRLEALNRKLFSKNPKLIRPKRPGVLHERSVDISRDWKGMEAKKDIRPPMIAEIRTPQSSAFFKKLFFYSLGFLALAVGFAFFVFERGSNAVSADNIDMSILGNTFTAGGEDLALAINVTNKNAVELQYSELDVSYPKGAGDSTSDNDFVHVRETIGTLGAGKSIDQNLKVVLYGELGATKDITATLDYRIPGSNAIFTKVTKYSVTISSAPLNLSIDAPKSSSSNQEVTLTLKVVPNATKTIAAVAVRADYPPGFQFKSAIPAPSVGSNVWNIGDLAPGIEKTIQVVGTLVGQDNEDRSFRFAAGELSPTNQSALGVVYSTLLQTITIARPFIDARLTIGGADQPEYYISSKNQTQVSIDWINNSPAEVDNVEISAALGGNALDRASVTALSGFYNSAANTIVWDRNSVSQFAAIQPGDSGSLSFSLASLGLKNGDQTFIDSPTITVEVDMKGTQTAEGSTPVAINNAQTKTIKINSDLQIASQAFYHSGPFANTGALPPKAEQPTSYTIVWTVNNTSNPISGAVAVASLPTYVQWLGKISPSTENVTFDPTTHQVTWRIGQIQRGAGASGGEKSVAFQIAATPSLSQIGSSIPILGETTLTGTDSFTGVKLSSKKGELTSALFNDPGFPTNGGTVVQ
jgi:hypothetical protein